MNDTLNVLLALLIVIVSIWLIFKTISWLAVFFRARVVKNKKIPLPPKYQRMLNDKKVLVLYFSSPLSERGRKKMTPVMKLLDEEYNNVIKFNITTDKSEAEKFNVISAPTIIILDSEGVVREYKTGFLPYPKIKSLVEKYLKK